MSSAPTHVPRVCVNVNTAFGKHGRIHTAVIRVSEVCPSRSSPRVQRCPRHHDRGCWSENKLGRASSLGVVMSATTFTGVEGSTRCFGDLGGRHCPDKSRVGARAVHRAFTKTPTATGAPPVLSSHALATRSHLLVVQSRSAPFGLSTAPSTCVLVRNRREQTAVHQRQAAVAAADDAVESSRVRVVLRNNGENRGDIPTFVVGEGVSALR